MKQLAVLGSPIGQALSPVLHRAAYHAFGLNWTYRCPRPVGLSVRDPTPQVHDLAKDLQAEIDRTTKGFHRAVAGMAAAGNNLVVDYPLSRRRRLLDLLDVLVPENTVLIGVRCPLSELERREIERGDRQRGLAALQYHEVHSHELHDLDVDTSVHSPRECALRIRDALPVPRPTAFETLRRRLRQRRGGDPTQRRS